MDRRFSVIHDPEAYAIVGSAMEVHRELGHRLHEAVYQEALAIECELRGIPVEREKLLPIFYKERVLQTHYRADLVCYGHLIVECKAISALGNGELCQVINYLEVTQELIALLLNFGAPSLEHRRVHRNLLRPSPNGAIPKYT